MEGVTQVAVGEEFVGCQFVKVRGNDMVIRWPGWSVSGWAVWLSGWNVMEEPNPVIGCVLNIVSSGQTHDISGMVPRYAKGS